jgi:hypothetical protein
MNKKLFSTPIIIFVLILSVFFVIINITLASAETPWLDSSIDPLKTDPWFTTSSDYRDCSSDSCGNWPENFLDCLIPDDNGGPTLEDALIVSDPPNLYYKHLTPLNLSFSGESLVVGLEGGMCGTTTRSLTLMVHPDSELPKIASVGAFARVEEYYLPFVLGATGYTSSTISTSDLLPLYDAAVYHCADGSDGTGYGTTLEVGEYVIVVQHWDMHRDCNIHVVNATLNPTPTPSTTPIDTPVPTDTPVPSDTPIPTNTMIPDTTAPVIDNISVVDIFGTSAQITWDTDEPSDSWVEYGYEKGGRYSYNQSTILDPVLVEIHIVDLINLKVDKVYHYRVYSTDASGNTDFSDDQTFISTPGSTPEPSETPPDPTPTPTPVTSTAEPTPNPFNISNVVVVDIYPTSARITWDTDISSNALVEYGVEKIPGVIVYNMFSPHDQTMSTSHSILLSGLKKNNSYHFRVISVDAEGSTAISTDYIFDTPLK